MPALRYSACLEEIYIGHAILVRIVNAMPRRLAESMQPWKSALFGDELISQESLVCELVCQNVNNLWELGR